MLEKRQKIQIGYLAFPVRKKPKFQIRVPSHPP